MPRHWWAPPEQAVISPPTSATRIREIITTPHPSFQVPFAKGKPRDSLGGKSIDGGEYYYTRKLVSLIPINQRIKMPHANFKATVQTFLGF